MPIPTPLDPPARLLCGPGPSDVEPSVLAAMRRPMLGHLDPDFHAILDEVVAMLRAVWRMPAGDVLALPATGTTAMEAGLANLLEPGETVIVGVAGFFGARLADMAERQGARSTPTPGRTSSPSSTRRRRRAPSTRCASWARRSPATTRCSWPTA